MKFVKEIIPFLLVVIISFLTILPLFHSGFFSFHDDTQVQRVFEMGKALGDFVFPVRWVSDLGYGYGYPIFNFYAPFAYYIGGFLMLPGFNALIATKVMIGMGMVTSGVCMYFLGKNVWGVWGGAVSGILYVFAPYHALNLYVRGDIAELWAYTFLPLIFLGIFYCYKNELAKGITVGSLGYALVIISHNLTALMISPFIALILIILSYYSFRKKDSLSIKGYMLIVILGILLSSFYSLPVLFEMKYTNVLSQIGGGADFRDHFVCLPQLWNSVWGFGGSTRDCLDGLSFRIGKLHIILLLLSFASAVVFYKKHKEKAFIVVICTAFFAIGMILLFPISKPFWELIGPMEFFQYPWRFLMVLSFFSSLAGGFVVVIFDSYKKYYSVKILFILTLMILIILLYLKLFVPQSYNNRTSKDYTDKDSLQWAASKISDEYMPVGFQKPEKISDLNNSLITNANNIAQVTYLTRKTGLITGSITAFSDANYRLNIAYFPAWKLFVDNKQVNLIKDPKGMIVKLTKGTHEFKLQFVQTPIERIANFLTLCGFGALVAVIIYLRQHDRRSQKTS